MTNLLKANLSKENFLNDSPNELSPDYWMLSESRNNFTSFFPRWMHFISLSCLNAVARIYSTLLNSSGDSGHICLIPKLRGKTFNLSPLSKILATGFFINALCHVDALTF